MLTFAIASRNREKKLKVCIDSICDQIDGLEGFKVVVCDNASTDGTKELLEEYAARYKFVKYRSISEVYRRYRRVYGTIYAQTLIVVALILRVFAQITLKRFSRRKHSLIFV